MCRCMCIAFAWGLLPTCMCSLGAFPSNFNGPLKLAINSAMSPHANGDREQALDDGTNFFPLGRGVTARDSPKLGIVIG